MSTEREYYENLTKIMLKTRGVRFQVAESESKKEKFSIATISILSIYLASWSLILSMFPSEFTTFQNKALGLSSVVASVSLLAISIFDYAASRSVFAEKMLQNAFAISEILRETERHLASANPDYERLAELAKSYEVVVVSAGVNHTSREYKLWQLEKQTAKSIPDAVWLWGQRKVLHTFNFFISRASQIILLVLLLGATAGILLL